MGFRRLVACIGNLGRLIAQKLFGQQFRSCGISDDDQNDMEHRENKREQRKAGDNLTEQAGRPKSRPYLHAVNYEGVLFRKAHNLRHGLS